MLCTFYRCIVFGIIILITKMACGQDKKEYNLSIKIDVLQILATTLDVNYEIEYKPFISQNQLIL